MIDAMEIMQSSFLYSNVVSASFSRIKVWYSQCKNVQNAGFKQILVLVLYSGFSGVEKC